MWVFTTNNLSATLEISRRIPRIRLEPQVASNVKRDLKTLKYPKIADWVKEHRLELLAALYSIANHWIESGCPEANHKRYLPSFENWSEVMGGILASAKIEGFLENQNDYSGDLDDESEFMDEIFKLWSIRFGTNAVRPLDLMFASEIAKEIGQMFLEFDSGRHISLLGSKLREWNGRVSNGFKLQIAKDQGRSGGRQYRLVKLDEEGSLNG